MDNAFTPLVRALAPSVDAALALLERFGAARMSGTGSTCFLAFENEAAARSVAMECADRFPVQVVRGVDRSSLSDAVEQFAANVRLAR
jgi:4-diphosphocytidyl-2-C-methyl-D-erythritol kinase